MCVSIPEPIPPAATISDVVASTNAIIDWSITAGSRLGYFAALYKRITVAVAAAIAVGAFENAERMNRFDVVFAQRYFDAVNGYFHPADYPKPSRAWKAAFDAATQPAPIMVEHMLAGVDVHIALDLGIAAHTIAPGAQLPALKEDFYRINAVLASQVNGVIADINQLSPLLAELYEQLGVYELFLVNQFVAALRDRAWWFAQFLAAQPGFTRPLSIQVRDVWIAREVNAFYGALAGPLLPVRAAIAAQENRDVVHNIQILDHIAVIPAPISTAIV